MTLTEDRYPVDFTMYRYVQGLMKRFVTPLATIDLKPRRHTRLARATDATSYATDVLLTRLTYVDICRHMSTQS